MELLKKKPKRDTDDILDTPPSDRLPLFPKGTRIDSAQSHRGYWKGIDDQRLQENISYQMQYLEFQVKLYNTYEMYLTLESLHLKNIRATVANIIEASLYNLVDQGYKAGGYEMDERISFMDLIDEAYDMKIIEDDLRGELHQLRMDRNKIHFRSLKYQEYSAYEVDEINEAIETLNHFISQTQPEYQPTVAVATPIEPREQ